MRFLILCTGNSCRSQMAEGIIKSFDESYEVYSAGTNPSEEVSPYAVKVMKELGIDISNNYPKNSDKFVNESFDYVITVCDNAKEICPIFMGDVKQQLHIGFDDPAEVIGTEEKIISEFRRVRDEIKFEFGKLFSKK